MDRMACVDIRNLPLQVLLRKKPEWKDFPVAVVDRDKPNGTIRYVNKRGRACRILPGLSYGTGLSLCRDLRGGVVSPIDIEEAVSFITQRLWQFSPRIEPWRPEPGVFWLDASGMRQLFSSLKDWADSIHSDLRGVGFYSVVAVGFTRFGSYAGARSKSGSVVFGSAQEENDSLKTTPIDCLKIDPGFRDMLIKLNVTTLDGFIGLPSEGIRKRFGPEAKTWHETARGEHWHPLQPHEFRDPIERIVTLDYPESSADRLLFIVARLLNSMLGELSRRHEALKTLHLEFKLGDGGGQACEISPATPTLDARQILMLVRLRLERLTLTAGVEELKTRASGERAPQHQLDLFKNASGRNLELAHQAIAKLRAFLNQDAIACARLHDGHLPEAQYRWEAVRRIRSPQPVPAQKHALVKRIFSPPVALPPRPPSEPDGWLIGSISEEPVDEIRGRYVVSGGWWVQEEAARAYYYVRTRDGRWLWIYHDQKRRRWFLHGELH